MSAGTNIRIELANGQNLEGGHWLEELRSELQFVLYFCGHGKIHGNDLFLILPESRKDAILECYDFRNIVRKLKLIGGNKALFIVDACHSAAMLSSIEELMTDYGTSS